MSQKLRTEFETQIQKIGGEKEQSMSDIENMEQ